MQNKPEQMRAGLLAGPKHVEIRKVPLPIPGKGEVRIRMSMVGICGSDVSLFQGHRPDLVYPLIPGHEGIGYVEKLGEGIQHLQVGDRVVIEPNYPCGTCEFCRRGRGNICPDKRIIGVRETGCFADYFVAPEAFAWKLPASISDEDAVVIEPTAVALHTLFTSPARPGDTIAVMGLGAIGLLVAYVGLKMGYQVVAYDRLAEKAAFARELGAKIIPADAAVTGIAQYWREASVHTIFECAGAAQALTVAAEAAPRGAYIIVAGLSDKPSNISEFMMTRLGINILTSLIYDHPVDFKRAISLIESGFLQPGKIISRQVNFESISDALTEASSGIHAKIILNLQE